MTTDKSALFAPKWLLPTQQQPATAAPAAAPPPPEKKPEPEVVEEFVRAVRRMRPTLDRRVVLSITP